MRFKKIYIEITNTCNLACSFCIQNHREPRKLSIQEFQQIIDQIKPYTKFVYLHVLGEPLSHPDLQAFLSICEQAKIQVNMTTNGTLLKQKEEVLLTSKLRQINVSLHSFPQHYQKEYIKNTIEVCSKLAKQKTYVSYRLWSMQDGVLSEDTKQIVQMLQEAYGCEISTIEKGTIRLSDYTFLHFEEVFTWPSLTHPYVGTEGTCLGMKQMCGILSNGDVVTCCLDSKGDSKLGNIFETSFQEIIHSEKAIAIVDGFLKQEVIEPLCQHCSYRLRFTKSNER